MTTTDGLTLALVIITGAYTLGTFLILRANKAAVEAMRDQIESQTRPYVSISVFIQPGAPVFFLRIKNTGTTSANNLRLQLDRSFKQGLTRFDNLELQDFTAFTQEIVCLPPASELLFLLGSGHTFFENNADEEKTPKVFSITAKYNAGQRTFSEVTAVDLRPFQHSNLPEDPVAEELEKIRKSLDGLKNAVDRARIDLVSAKEEPGPGKFN